MKDISIICCSVLRKEVEKILVQDYPDIKPIFLDSMLHMNPMLLQKTLEETLQKQDKPTLVIYGDCGPDISGLENRYHCVVTPAVNCTELIVGHDKYDEFRRKMAFVMLPEWTLRWKHIFQDELGFSNKQLASLFMHENRKVLIYLDTGIIPVPTKALHEIEIFFSMPVEIVSEPIENLRAYIHDGIERLRRMSQDQ